MKLLVSHNNNNNNNHSKINILSSYSIMIIAAFLLISSSSSAENQVLGNETDKMALLSFKSQIHSDPFRALASWNESVHFCQWRGIICSRRHRQRVIVLDLQHQKLQGSITPYIGNLSFLHKLFLSNNSFTGEIPAEVGRLRRLEKLWVANNLLSGEIPSNMSSCSNLRHIYLPYNNLVGQLPAELGVLSKLTYIGAWNNNLTGHIPPSFGNLTLLKVIDFDFNSLSGSIPEELGRLSKLEDINLGQNRLLGFVPHAIYNLSNLEGVDLGHNYQLQGTIPSYIDVTLPHLNFFALEFNQFTGSIPKAISNMSTLEYLFLIGNKLSGQVPTFKNLNKLFAIQLDGNLLGSREHDDLSFISSLTNASNLETLSVGSNNFGGTFPKSFVNLSTQLQLFDLRNNHISGSLPLPSLSKFVNMNEFLIGNNDLTGNILASLGELPTLQYLHLSLNRFFGRIPSFLGNISMLLRLYLEGNQFTGEIPPSLANCTKLELLDISDNTLNGTIPRKLFQLSSLVLFLDLSHNQLQGPLPPQVQNLKNLGKLHVSNNMLSGEIPSTLDQCTSLEELYMDGNFFTGAIPQSLNSLRGLRSLDLSKNNLSGEIPDFLGDFDLQYLNLSHNSFEGHVPEKGIFTNLTAMSVVGNSKLCGGASALHLPRCSTKESKHFVSTSTFRLVMSSVSGFLVISLLIIILCLRRRRGKKMPSTESFVRLLPMVSYHTLYQATDGFSSANLIGTGGYASVYRGVMESDGEMVAVKVFNLLQQGASKSWIAECEALKNIRHRNLVKVLTACSSLDRQGNEFKALVYEFMSNGSLEQWLHPNSKLSFLQRLNVLYDVACALNYLHHHSHEPIVHRDLKPSNVLLDENFVAHVGDFGLARLLLTETGNQESTSRFKGTIGYTAPEYGMASEVLTSGDMYSFGILLLEMFTGIRPTSSMFNEGLNLHTLVTRGLPDRVVQITDLVLVQEIIEMNTEEKNIQEECLISVFRVGLACSTENATERMDIRDTIVEIHAIKNIFSETVK